MANFITWEFVGTNEIVRRLERIIPQLAPANRDLARTAGRIILTALRKEAPVGTHYIISGNQVTATYPETLKKSLIYRTYAKKDYVELKFYAAEHVKYVVNPVRGHWITAKKGKFLRFYWPGAPPELVEKFGGNIMYFKQVWHPAQKANPFHERAFKSVQTEVESLMTQYGATVIETLEGRQGRFFF